MFSHLKSKTANLPTLGKIFLSPYFLLSTVNCQLSTVNCQLSTVNRQLSNFRAFAACTN
ncbi:MAG: hypothetical protein JGK08_15455 [Microcoleus sp. PH2017_04_SCI_O_A]|nr:hypothetical protein [Microcoleus sp. PH2017_04_SCI_O_A]